MSKSNRHDPNLKTQLKIAVKLKINDSHKVNFKLNVSSQNCRNHNLKLQYCKNLKMFSKKHILSN